MMYVIQKQKQQECVSELVVYVVHVVRGTGRQITVGVPTKSI